MSSKHFAPIVPRSPLHVCKRGKHWVPCPNSTTTENYFFRAAHTRVTRHRILLLRMRSINATYKFHTIGDERVKKKTIGLQPRITMVTHPTPACIRSDERPHTRWTLCETMALPNYRRAAKWLKWGALVNEEHKSLIYDTSRSGNNYTPTN